MRRTAIAETIETAPFAFRFEFPPDIAAEREQVLAAIRRQMTEGTRASVARGAAMQAAWLDRFPDDYGMWDIGEALWMLADALDPTAPEAVPALLTR